MFCLSLMYQRKAKHCKTFPCVKDLTLFCWLPQASGIRGIRVDQHLPRVFGKSGFFRQQLMTSISRQRLNFRNAHQDPTADLYPWYRDLIWKNWFSRTKISFSFFTFGTLSIHKRRRCDRKMSYTNMIICRDCCPKFATGLKYLNRHT